jgi:glycogen debranching enzyme
MSTIPTADMLAGEEVLLAEEVLAPDDKVFDPSQRPDVESALRFSSGIVGQWKVPFASGTFDHHENVPEQGLFRCLFGRDSLIISSLLQSKDPSLQLNTVCALAASQGDSVNAASEEEPGRIPHEVRDVNDPQAKKITAESGWLFPYYGSVDATLLWLIALDEIVQSDSSFLERQIEGQSLAARAEKATLWVLERLQTGGGFIRSSRSNPKGILNQVWKDSGDSYLTNRGEVATSKDTVSVETISQCFDALMAAARISHLCSTRWSITPTELQSLAMEIRNALLGSWWLGDRFAMGLGIIGGQEVLLDAVASNQWRLLDSEILTGQDSAEYATQLVESVTDPEILGPNGIRTLGKSNPRYRPGGYHTGSSWPMDTALITRGLLRHGARKQALEVSSRTIKAIEQIGSYPELFRSDDTEKCGVSRFVIDVWDPVIGASNRICQPPQLLQGWTIAAFSWFETAGLRK